MASPLSTSEALKVEKLNQFQRFIRRFRDFPRYMGQFRRRHPYGFSFIAAAVATIPVLAALGVMIAFPPATPVVLGGAAAFAAHLGLATFIPAFAGASVLASAVVGGIAAGVRRGFAGISRLFRKPSLVSVSEITASSGVERERRHAILNEIVNMPTAASPRVSSSAVIPQPALEEAAAVAPIVEPAPAPKPALPDITQNPDYQAYKQAKGEFQAKTTAIKSQFDEMIQLATSLPSSHGGSPLFRLKSNLIETIKSFKKEFISGHYDGKGNLDYWADKLLEQAPDLNATIEALKSNMTEVNKTMESREYQAFLQLKARLLNLQDGYSNNMADHAENRRNAAFNGLTLFSTFDVNAEAAKLKFERQTLKCQFGAGIK